MPSKLVRTWLVLSFLFCLPLMGQPLPESCCDEGKPRRLVLQYTATDCGGTDHQQDSKKVRCNDLGVLPAQVFILANDNKKWDKGKVWFADTVMTDETFAVDASAAGKKKLKSKTYLHIFDMQGGSPLQVVEFHTSCSQPLFVGDQFGSLSVVDCEGDDPSPPADAISCCDEGKPRTLVLEYTGEGCEATSHFQDPGKVQCLGSGALTPQVYIIANDKDEWDGGTVWFSGDVLLNETFAIDAAVAGKDKLKSKTFLHVFDAQDGVLLQMVEFHTSCSQPLFIGDQFGSLSVVDCEGDDSSPPADAMSCCDEGGKPRALVLEFTGEGCDAASHFQDLGKVQCLASGVLTPQVYIIANDKDEWDDGTVWFSGDVLLNESFTIDAAAAGKDKLKSKTFLHVFDAQDGMLLQMVEFHTSCSQPLLIGDQFGSALVLDCIGEDDVLASSCAGGAKPRSLVMEYTGGDCDASSHAQDTKKVDCSGSGSLPDEVYVIANDKKDWDKGTQWFSGSVLVDEMFTIDASSGGKKKLKSKTFLHIFDMADGQLLQTVEFHTSCSQPLSVGDQFGSAQLVEFTAQR